MIRRFICVAVPALALALAAVSAQAETLRSDAELDRLRSTATDWPWWRGPRQDGIAAADQKPPLRWSETENVVWKSPVPGRGHGSPTIVGSQ